MSKQFRIRACRTDYEVVAADYEFFITIEAESREEALRMILEGEYEESEVEEYNSLGTDPIETQECGDVWDDSVMFLDEDDDEELVEEPTSQFP